MTYVLLRVFMNFTEKEHSRCHATKILSKIMGHVIMENS
jgi:hypothetical protein